MVGRAALCSEAGPSRNVSIWGWLWSPLPAGIQPGLTHSPDGVHRAAGRGEL